MLNAALRRSGGSLILTIPPAYVEQNGLQAGAKLEIFLAGSELTWRVPKKSRKLADLLKATPEGEQRAAGWDELGSVVNEL
jgi:antitoxin ChpS